MRSFAQVPPTTWQTEVKKLRGDTNAIAVYFHLLTSLHSSMIGVYPLAIGYMAHDLGIPPEGASKGLQRVCESGLATYDPELELVWVHDMAAAQIATRLSPKDNKVVSVGKQLELLPICPITLAFYGKWRDLYHLKDLPNLDQFESAFQGASEGLRSKDKEKEQDKEQDLEEEEEYFGSGNEKISQPDRKSMFTPFPIPSSAAEAKRILISEGVPQHRLDECVREMMGGNFSRCELEGVLESERSAA